MCEGNSESISDFTVACKVRGGMCDSFELEGRSGSLSGMLFMGERENMRA